MMLQLLASTADTIHSILDLMNRGGVGYVVLFGLLFLCGLGLPLPEDIPLICAGILIGGHHMNPWIAGVVAWLGIIGGDCMLYRLGWRYGLNITRVPFVGKHVTRERIEKAEKLFERYGIWVVAVGRLVAGIRGAMVVAAGTIRYNFIKFIIADSLAAIVSGGMFIFVGYLVGNNIAALLRYKEYVFWGLLAAGVGVVIYFYVRHRLALGAKSRAGAAAPGADAAARGPAADGAVAQAPPADPAS